MIRIIPVGAALALLPLSAPALASAWTQDEGKGLIIVTGVLSDSPKGFDADGRTIDIPDYERTEVFVFAEYGVTDDLTVIVAPSFRDVSVDSGGNVADEASGLGFTELGARYRVAEGNGWTAAVQASIRIPGQQIDTNLAQIGATDSEYDLRGAVGRSFKIGEADAFFDAQGAYRLRSGDPPNEFQVNVTFGVRPVPRALLLAQVFNTFSDGAGQGVFTDYRFHNAQLSIVYDLNQSVALQLGGLATLGGENALRERGVFAGVWFRF